MLVPEPIPISLQRRLAALDHCCNTAIVRNDAEQDEVGNTRRDLPRRLWTVVIKAQDSSGSVRAQHRSLARALARALDAAERRWTPDITSASRNAREDRKRPTLKYNGCAVDQGRYGTNHAYR